MIWVYFDASALVKRYSPEQGTKLVNDLFQNLPIEQMTCAVIGIVEIISVLVRKRNDGRLSSKLFKHAINELNKEIIEADNFAVASVDDYLILSAVDLIERHNINSSDAIVLRSCLNVQQKQRSSGNRLILCSCDKRLLKAAQNEGLEVFDPEVETVVQLQKLLADN